MYSSLLGAWVVSSHADVVQVLTDHDTFSSDELRYSTQDIPHRDNPVLRSILAMDPPEHHRLRRIVSQAFTPMAVASLDIASTVHGLLDGLDSRVEVIGSLAYPLSVGTIAGLLGVQASRQADFIRWTDAITSFAGSFTSDPLREKAFQDALASLRAYFLSEFANPRGVISTLVNAGLDPESLVNFSALLLLNGHETTKTLLTQAVVSLAPMVSELRATPSALPTAIEEVLRCHPPTGGTDRFTTKPTTLGGHEIAAGQRVIAMITRANRDPAVFPNPDTFDIHRTPNPHLSFGHGIHTCLGAHLARLEVTTALCIMLDRLPGPWTVTELESEETPVGTDLLKVVLTWGT